MIIKFKNINFSYYIKVADFYYKKKELMVDKIKNETSLKLKIVKISIGINIL